MKNQQSHPELKLGVPCFPAIRAVTLPDAEIVKHLAIIGPDEAVRGLHIAELLQQQTHRGGGWVHFMHAEDTEVLSRLQQDAVNHGRAADFSVINLAEPGAGNTYNPLLTAIPADAAWWIARLVVDEKLWPTVHARFKQLVQVVLDYGFRRGSFVSLKLLRAVTKEPQVFVPIIAKDPVSARALEIAGFVKNGHIDEHSLDLITSAGKSLETRLSSRGAGAFNLTKSQVVLKSVVQKNGLCCVVLPRPAAGESADLLAMLLQDLASAIVSRNEISRPRRGPSFLVSMQDVERLAGLLDPKAKDPDAGLQPLMPLLRKARSALVGLVLGTPALHLTNRKTLSATLAGNTQTKVWHAGLSQHEIHLADRIVDTDKAHRKLASIKEGSFLVLREGSLRRARSTNELTRWIRPFHLRPRETAFSAVELQLSTAGIVENTGAPALA